MDIFDIQILVFYCLDTRRGGASHCVTTIDAHGRSQAASPCGRYGRHEQTQQYRRSAQEIR